MNFIVVIFISLFVSLPVYAAEIFEDVDLCGGSRFHSWEEDKVELQAKLMDRGNYGRKYKKEEALKDFNYISFVCLTYNKPYRVYKEYEDMFMANVNPKFKIERYDKLLYEERLMAMKKIMEVSSVENKEEMVAFSGFNYKLDVLPFNNLAFSDARDGGVCVGMVYYEALNYLQPEALKVMDFSFLTGKISRFDEEYGPLLDVDTEIVASKDEVFEDRLYKYEPMDIKLRTNVVTNAMQDWEESTPPTKEKVTLSEIEPSTTDDNMLKSIYWLWGWGNLICNEQIDLLKEEGHFDSNLPVITGNMLEVMKSELEAGRPLSIIIGRTSGARHCVLGYKLSQDAENEDIYYLHVADSNYPANYYNGREEKFRIVFCKGTYNGEEALYYMYGPNMLASGSSLCQYAQDLVISDSFGVVLNRSTNLCSWGAELTTYTVGASDKLSLSVSLPAINSLRGEYFAPNYFNMELNIRSGTYVSSRL